MFGRARARAWGVCRNARVCAPRAHSVAQLAPSRVRQRAQFRGVDWRGVLTAAPNPFIGAALRPARGVRDMR
eukprot:2115525-Lingulodinium_polyedra.AAC.1